MMNGKIDKKLAKEADKYNKERLEECIPVAHEIIKIIADSGLSIGDTHARDNAQYEVVSKQILKLMLEKNLRYTDKDFIFQLILQPFDQVRQIVTKSLLKSLELAEEKAFGKNFLDLRLSDLNDVMLGYKKSEEKH